MSGPCKHPFSYFCTDLCMGACINNPKFYGCGDGCCYPKCDCYLKEMVKEKKYVVEYCELTPQQKDSISRFLLEYYGPVHNGSSFHIDIEINETPNPIEKLLLELGYEKNDSVLFRISW